MKHRRSLLAALALCAAPLLHAAPATAAPSTPPSARAAQPNIVLVLMDNLGYGELGVYGGGTLRGAPTPRIDRLAGEGARLLNFNVEAQCTPSRAALLTGRYAVRTGNGSVPIDTQQYGLVQWEVTLARMLSNAGYATAAFGKWHLGDTPGRYPTDHGFDQWYGIPNSSDESYWANNPMLRPGASPLATPTYVLQSRKGQAPEKVKVYDQMARRLIDGELTDKTIAFMRSQVKANKPFFAYVPMTMPHFPILPHPDFDGKTGNGMWGDTLAQIDAYTGKLLDAVEQLGIRDNTIFIFTSDNGPEMTEPWRGSAGPWRGTYFTALEGSLRVPFIVRWPGKIPAGMVSNGIMHEMDVMPTLARMSGASVPANRAIDGVDQSDFLTGKQVGSNRAGFVVYVGNDIYGVKWGDWKMMNKELETGTSAIKQYSVPRIYNLHLDPREELGMATALENLWVRYPMMQLLGEHLQSFKKSPAIRPGQSDPYLPPPVQPAVQPTIPPGAP